MSSLNAIKRLNSCMDNKEKFAEFCGKVIATLEQLGKSDDEISNRIEDVSDELRTMIKDLESRIRRLENSLACLEAKFRLYWWITSGLIVSLVLGVFSIILNLWI